MNPTTPESGFSAIPDSVLKNVAKSVEEAKASCEKVREGYMVREIVERGLIHVVS